MTSVKIYGAGSIGNHLAQASRSLGWSVDIFDIDEQALFRTKNEIYPQRYGGWDDQIGLYTNQDDHQKHYDYIFIGTPPDKHIELALAAIEDKPTCILVEKPFCTPDLQDADKLLHRAHEEGIRIFTGYDHVIGEAAIEFERLLQTLRIGGLLTLDVEFREHWGGIFNAHSWLKGPEDSYLGFWHRGGGATGEHSHALNLWQHFASIADKGRVVKVSSQLEFVKDSMVNYDQLSLVNLTTEKGFTGRVVQDVITSPAKKWARVQGENGFIEWECGIREGQDRVLFSSIEHEKHVNENVFEKTRPDDFIRELKHIENIVNTKGKSPISIEKGLETMLVIAAVYKSSKESKSVTIDYDKGFSTKALT